MKKVNKSAKIREAIEAGETAQSIAKSLKIPVGYVYNERYKMKKAGVKAKALARKKKQILKVTNKVFDKEYSKAKMIFEHKPVDPALEFLRDELASVERQIDTLNTVASFLTIRLRQMEQNNG